jgi:hypothetical protein
MAFDDSTLSETHTITRLSIQSNTQISAKATNVISKLSAITQQDSSTTTNSAETNIKPPLIILRAQSRWASKLISIVEIAKRNLESPPTTSSGGDTNSNGIKIFQYSSLSTEMIEIERKPKPKGLAGGAQPLPGGEGDGSDDDEEGAFQTMGASPAATATAGSGEGEEGGLKKRAVPVLTVYLAARPVKALRSEFGWV